MRAARDTEPEGRVLANLLRIIGCREAIEGRVGGGIGMLGDCVQCTFSQMSIPIFGHECTQVRDALPRIDTGHDRYLNSARVDRAVGAQKANAADLLVFYAIENGNAVGGEVIAIIGLTRK